MTFIMQTRRDIRKNCEKGNYYSLYTLDVSTILISYKLYYARKRKIRTPNSENP